MPDSGPNVTALYRDAIARAFQEQVQGAFAVLVDGLATKDVAPARSEEEIFALFCVGIGLAQRAYEMAAGFAEAKSP